MASNENYTLPSDLAHIIADPVLLLPDFVGAVEDPVITKIETNKDGEQLIWISGTFDPSLIQDEAVRGYAQSIGERPVELRSMKTGSSPLFAFPGPLSRRIRAMSCGGSTSTDLANR